MGKYIFASSAIFMLDFQAARWLSEKQIAGQVGNNHPTSVPTGVFKTLMVLLIWLSLEKQFGKDLQRLLTENNGFKWKNLEMQNLD